MSRKNSSNLWRGVMVACLVAALVQILLLSPPQATARTQQPSGLSAFTCAPNFVCHLSGGLFYVDSTTKVTVVNAAICTLVKQREATQRTNKTSGQDQALEATDSGLQAVRTACELGKKR